MHTDTAAKQMIIRLLKTKAVNITEARIDITSIIYQSQKWLSLTDILQHKNNAYNRATVFRTLRLLYNQGFIEKMVDIHKTAYYFFRQKQENDKNEAAIVDEHTYFNCLGCGGITILPAHGETISVPEGFKKVSGNLIISGYCDTCSKIYN
jgi:Fe2+ or Zn2+ uptake regulation protein